MKRLLLAVCLTVGLAAAPGVVLAVDGLPDPLPPPECPWLGGCDLGDPTPPVPVVPEPCGLGVICLGSGTL